MSHVQQGAIERSNGEHLRAAVAAMPSRSMLVAALAAVVAAAAWLVPASLPADGRIVLLVTALCIVGWALTRIPDVAVALTGILALVLFGALPVERLYASLGNEIVWLIVAAFLIAGVLRASGLVERVLDRALRPVKSVAGLFAALTLLVSATAFLVPSTSGRAALLLPVFIALIDRLPDARLVRPLALLFPSVILLSAGAALTGAGAHVIAVDVLSRSAGVSLDPLLWTLLAAPISLAASFASTLLILWLFVPRALRFAPIAAPDSTDRRPLDRRQIFVAVVIVALVAAWFTTLWHGLDIALVALIGAVVLMSRFGTDRKPKEVFRSVEMDLVLFLAATAALAEAMTATGLDRWMATGIMEIAPPEIATSTPFAVAFAAIVSLLAHLVISSRSARAAVLIPAVALPIAALGHDPVAIVMVTVLGTGFCQTTMASAKPVAIFGQLERPTFSQGDLFRLAVPLLPVKFALLVAAALFVW